MSDFMEIVKGRRSVRKYKADEVPAEALETVLEAVRWSPSWANTQVWEIVVITDRAVKEQLQGVLSDRNPATRAMVDAPVVLAVCGKLGASGYYNNVVTTRLGDWYAFDLGIATQTLCLTAHSLGLGTVVVGLFDHAKAEGILGVPEGYELTVLIPLGYPAKEGVAPKRREVAEFVHHEKF